jgi:transposase
VKEEEREIRDQQITDFRYSVVADLANPYLDAGKLRQLLRDKAGREWDVPGGGRRRLSEGCIRKWLAVYRQYGKAGLQPKRRRDAGRPRALPVAEAAMFLNYLETHPHLTASSVLRKLQAEGKIRNSLSSSSLSRLVRSAGLERHRRLRETQKEQNLKFDFFAPLECVQADCMYALKIADEKGKLHHAILLAFIDDATRRILYATFSYSESSLCFEAGIRHILSAHGRIGRLYADNGSSFVSAQTHRILDTLGIVLIHSRPYRPAGRGKIERFFRTSREQFFRLQDPQSTESLEALEIRFHSWLESEYHRSPHRGLNAKTPLEAWVEKARHIIPTDPTVDLDEVFRHEVRRKVYKDSTVTLDGVLFEVPSTLIGERIILRYDPHLACKRRRLFLFYQGSPCGEARLVDSYANARVRRSDVSRNTFIKEIESESERETPSAHRPTDASLAASRLTKENSK